MRYLPIVCSLWLFLISENVWGSESDDSIQYYLPGIVVETEPWLWPQDTLMGSVNVISIRAHGAKSELSRIIRSSVGIGIQSYGGPGSPKLLTLRGSSSEQVLLMLNGRRLTTAQGGGLDLSLWPSAWLSEVQIWRGGFQARLGGEAIGGVVNLISRPGLETKSNVDVVMGSQMLIGLDAATSSGGQSAKYCLALHGMRSNGEFWYRDDKRSIQFCRRNAEHREAGFMAMGSFKKAGVTLYGDLWCYQRSQGAPGMAEFPTPDARLEDEVYLAGVGLRWNTSSIYSGELQGYINWLHRRYSNPMPVYFAQDSHRNCAAGIVHHSKFHCFEWLSLSAGGELRLDHLNSTTDGRRRRFRGAFYSESRMSFWRKSESHARLIVNPGIRYEWIEEYSPQVSPCLNAKWQVIPKRVFLQASYGRSYRIPDFDDLFWPSTANAVGNPNLQPEKSIQTDLGLIFYPLASRFRLGITLYHREVWDLIEWAPGALGYWRPHNVGKADFRGLELEGNFFVPSVGVLDILEIETNYTYLRAIDRTGERNREGNQLIRRPRHRGNIIASIRCGSWRFLTQWHWVGKRYLTAANTKWLDPYLVGDLEMGRQINRNIDISLRLINILNRQYRDIREFPVPGRRWELSGRLNF